MENQSYYNEDAISLTSVLEKSIQHHKSAQDKIQNLPRKKKKKYKKLGYTRILINEMIK